MAYRGRGRGRGGYGGGGGGFSYAKQEPFELFPDIELPDRKKVPEEKNLIRYNLRLLNYWKSSPYFLEENVGRKNQSTEIERFSDWNKPKIASNRGSINQFLQLRSSNFPAELVKDSRGRQNPKRVRWNADAGLQKLDLFEKLEQKFQGQEEKDDKEKKEGEDEDEDEDEAAGEAEEEFSDDGDYNQIRVHFSTTPKNFQFWMGILNNENIDFDDDDDDFNMDDVGDDEATY